VTWLAFQRLTDRRRWEDTRIWNDADVWDDDGSYTYFVVTPAKVEVLPASVQEWTING